MKWLMAMGLVIAGCNALAGGIHPMGSRIMGLPDTIIKVSGVIVAPPPCQINNDKPTDVAFDDVVIQLVDGAHFVRTVPVQITCPGTFTGELDFMVKADAASFNSDAIATSNENLALQLIRNGSKMPINSWHAISWRQPIALQVVPIKNAAKSLSAGKFTANATMLIVVH